MCYADGYSYKSAAKELMSDLGSDMTTFFTMAAKQAIREQRIPFEISMNIPNVETIRAIEDVRHGRNLSRSFPSVEDIIQKLASGEQLSEKNKDHSLSGDYIGCYLKQAYGSWHDIKYDFRGG